MNKKKYYTLTVRMDDDLRNKLEYLQEQTALSKASIIRFGISGLYQAYKGD